MQSNPRSLIALCSTLLLLSLDGNVVVSGGFVGPGKSPCTDQQSRLFTNGQLFYEHIDTRCLIYQCRNNVKTVFRPCDEYREGVCPVNNVIGTCEIKPSHCFKDSQCPKGTKCCSRGCGRECVPVCNTPCKLPQQCTYKPCIGKLCPLLGGTSSCLPSDCGITDVPPSCENVQCDQTNRPQRCVLRQVICVRAPCYPVPVCVPDKCAAVRCGTGTVCQLQEKSLGQVTFACVPRTQPKPGFCPPPDQVSQSNGNLCTFDNDCASDLICCPGASRGGLNCTAPLHPDPCRCHTCPNPPVAGTCAVRNGAVTCLDRVCEPGSFYCRDNKQCYCNRAAEMVCTDIPAPSECPQ